MKFAEIAPRLGDCVIGAIGPNHELMPGIVSAQGRYVGKGPWDHIQTDLPFGREEMGGPTFNIDGEVVGVNTAIMSPAGVPVGIAFAIPAKTAVDVLAQLKSAGAVSRGWLGVNIQNIDEDTASILGLNEPKGALIVTVSGPAADAGLKNGDAILAVNGTKVADSRDMARQIATYQPDTKVDIHFLRAQKEQTIGVKLGRLPKVSQAATVDSGTKSDSGTAPRSTGPHRTIDQVGLTLAADANADGVVVVEVVGSSDAALKGIKSGEVILEIGGSVVKNPEDVANAVRNALKLQRKARLLRVRSGTAQRFVAVQLKTQAAVPGVTDAAREWSQVDKTSIAELETFARRHAASPEADYARARVEELKRQQTTVVLPPMLPPKTEREQQCVHQTARGTHPTEEGAKFIAWKAILQGMSEGSDPQSVFMADFTRRSLGKPDPESNFMKSDIKVGFAPGHKVSNMQVSCKTLTPYEASAGMAGQKDCFISATVCKMNSSSPR